MRPCFEIAPVTLISGSLRVQRRSKTRSLKRRSRWSEDKKEERPESGSVSGQDHEVSGGGYEVALAHSKVLASSRLVFHKRSRGTNSKARAACSNEPLRE